MHNGIYRLRAKEDGPAKPLTQTDVEAFLLTSHLLSEKKPGEGQLVWILEPQDGEGKEYPDNMRHWRPCRYIDNLFDSVEGGCFTLSEVERWAPMVEPPPVPKD